MNRARPAAHPMDLPLNALSREKSPYLQQHARNPVSWLPWGEAAFARARSENKPIFLSVGYSTCHWCHVMERESFEDAGIAELLNRDFVPVKVDREERPDVDRIYMMFVQATTGGGGWPMSVFLTPELKPFFGGTYFPPENRHGRPGFRLVLERLAEAWRQDRERIDEASFNVTEQLAGYCRVTGGGDGTPPEHIAEKLFYTLRRQFDRERGGFGTAPKFPRPAALDFLLRHHWRTGNAEALEMVLLTLRQMAAGGMNDQLGGGFHRYSVDAQWFVPHFEKMLYDQAQLMSTSVAAYQLTGDGQYAAIARSIGDYVLRDLETPTGGFCSAEDADSALDAAEPSRQGEGAFYVWRWEELFDVLGDKVAPWFAYRYGCLPGGNVTEDPHGEFTGRNILHAARSVEETARHFHADAAEVAQALASARPALLAARAGRPRPHLDDKILTAWNGLMISALAQAGAALGEVRYLEAAERAARFIAERMMAPGGVLLRRYRDGEAAIEGFLDDYAFFAAGLIDLYQSTFDPAWLRLARKIGDQMLARFEDGAAGAFFSTAEGAGDLILRVKDDYDGAEPAGNSVAIEVMLALEGYTQNTRYRDAAERALTAFGARLEQAAIAMPRLVSALVSARAPHRQVVLTGPEQTALREELARHYLPGVTLIDAQALPFPLEGVREMSTPDGRAAAWVCQNFACQLPVTRPEELAKLLNSKTEPQGAI